jgi:hypothetical protein
MSINAGLATRRTGEDFVDNKTIQIALAERRITSVARALRLTGQEDPPIEYIDPQSADAVGPRVAWAESSRSDVRHQA